MRLFISGKHDPQSGKNPVLKQNNLSGFLTRGAAYIKFMTDIFINNHTWNCYYIVNNKDICIRGGTYLLRFCA